MANLGFLGIGQLGRRLALAFIAVAVAAIVIDTVLSQVGVAAEITRVAERQEAGFGTAVARTAGAAYEGIGWKHADLDQAFDLVRRAGGALQVRDSAGHLVRSSPGFASMPASQQRKEAVLVEGRHVGSVTVKFGAAGLSALARNFEEEQWASSLAAAGIAAVLALVVSVEALRRITVPLDQMLTTARARGAGDRSARVEPVSGIGVVRELVEAFNQSIDFTDQQERVRRNLVANVAHELRTPVAILQAGHEAMADEVIAPTPQNLGSLKDEVLRLARMVADL